MINRFKEEYEEDCDCVVAINEYSISFKPLLINPKRFRKSIFKYADVVLMMSATILDYTTFLKYLGISQDEVAIVKCPSIFPIENNKIHFVDSGTMSYKTKHLNIDKTISNIDNIIDKNKNKKGIIHTVSNANVRLLTEKSRHSKKFVIASGKDRSELLDFFKYKANKDAILVSPSFTEGISLDDDMAEYSIIMKVPYGNLGDEWISKRMELDKRWYMLKTVRAIVQMAGRHQRNEKDVVDTYITDGNFKKVFQQYNKWFPESWKYHLKNI